MKGNTLFIVPLSPCLRTRSLGMAVKSAGQRVTLLIPVRTCLHSVPLSTVKWPLARKVVEDLELKEEGPRKEKQADLASQDDKKSNSNVEYSISAYHSCLVAWLLKS